MRASVLSDTLRNSLKVSSLDINSNMFPTHVLLLHAQVLLMCPAIGSVFSRPTGEKVERGRGS